MALARLATSMGVIQVGVTRPWMRRSMVAATALWLLRMSQWGGHVITGRYCDRFGGVTWRPPRQRRRQLAVTAMAVLSMGAWAVLIVGAAAQVPLPRPPRPPPRMRATL